MVHNQTDGGCVDAVRRDQRDRQTLAKNKIGSDVSERVITKPVHSNFSQSNLGWHTTSTLFGSSILAGSKPEEIK